MLDSIPQYANEVELRLRLPSMETHYDAVYIPIDDRVQWETDRRWGCYDVDGNLIDAAAYYRGSGKQLVGQSFYQSFKVDDFETAPPGDYFYGGNLISHYGHFLLSTFARFWPSLKGDLRSKRIVCHGAGNPDGWFSHSFVSEIFGAIGLEKKNFVVFKRPTIIPKLCVPRPSAEEHNFVHSVYADWGHMAGDSLLRQHHLPTGDRPIWLSKAAIGRGVQGLLNESVLESRLSEIGVEIIHPQTLSVAEQVALFRTRPTIIGTTSSAFHTSIFARPGPRLIGVTMSDTINSNMAIADMSNRNNMIYLKAKTERIQTGGSPSRFDEGFNLTDVDDLVAQITEAMSNGTSP